MQTSKRLTLKEQVIFFELTADLLAAGFQLQNALAFMTKLKGKRYKSVVEAMHRDMANGQSFANSIEPFVEMEISWQLELAEAHGSLANTISIIAQNLQQRFIQRRKLKQLMQYPVVLIVLLIAIGFFLRFYFIEQLIKLKGDTIDEMPMMHTDILVITLLICSLMMIIGYYWLRRLSVPQKMKLYIKLPIVNHIIKEQVSYQISFTMALLLQAGHSYQEISELFLKLPNTVLLHHIGVTIQQKSNAGENMASFISEVPYIPKEFALFFTRGKTNIEVGNDLLAYSKVSFQRLIKKYERLLAMIQPIMFISIAIGIVSMYAAMLLPMYKMIGEFK